MAKHGRESELNAQEADIVRAAARDYLRPTPNERRMSFSKFGKMVELSGSAVSQLVGNWDFGSTDYRPGEASARAIGRVTGRGEWFFRPGVAAESAQLHREGVRLKLGEDVTIILSGDPAARAGLMRRLSGNPEALQRAIVAVAYLTGFSLERVMVAAERALEAERKKGGDVEKHDPDYWHIKIRTKLEGDPGESGTYHAARVSSVPPAALGEGPPPEKPPRRKR